MNVHDTVVVPGYPPAIRLRPDAARALTLANERARVEPLIVAAYTETPLRQARCMGIHGAGTAIDIYEELFNGRGFSSEFRNGWFDIAAEYGWNDREGRATGRPGHFVYCPVDDRSISHVE